MIKLLRANLARTYKLIIVALVLYAVCAIMIPLIFYLSLVEETEATFIALAYNYGMSGVPVQAMFIALLCPIIYCSDFYNRTIKNKIVVGHAKSQIYLANFLTTAIISLMLSAVYLLIFLVIDLPLFGKTTAPAKDIILLLIDGTFMMLAYCAIFTFVSMTSRNSLTALIVTAALFTIGILIAVYCYDVASAVPYKAYPTYNEFGEVINENIYVNEHMPSKATQNFCQFLIDLFPSGQSWQLSNENIVRWQMPLYSLCVIGATTGAGIAIFNKSNIK